MQSTDTTTRETKSSMAGLKMSKPGIAGDLVGWLVGRLAGWLVSRSVWSVGRLLGRTINWLVGWLAGQIGWVVLGWVGWLLNLLPGTRLAIDCPLKRLHKSEMDSASSYNLSRLKCALALFFTPHRFFYLEFGSYAALKATPLSSAGLCNPTWTLFLRILRSQSLRPMTP